MCRAAQQVRERIVSVSTTSLFSPSFFSLLPISAAARRSYTWFVAGSASRMWWSHHGARLGKAAEGRVRGLTSRTCMQAWAPRRSCRQVRCLGACFSCLCTLVSSLLMSRSTQVTYHNVLVNVLFKGNEGTFRGMEHHA